MNVGTLEQGRLLHGRPRVDLSIAHFLPDIGQKAFQFLQTPSQSTGEESKAQAVNTLSNIFMAPHPYIRQLDLLAVTFRKHSFASLTHFFRLRILGPFICGPLVHSFYYILKASSFHLLLVQIRTVYRAAEVLGRFNAVIAPLVDCGVVGQSIVVGSVRNTNIRGFNPATWIEIPCGSKSVIT